MSEAIEFGGRVAIINRGATGVGSDLSLWLAARGAKVLIVGLPHDPVPELVEMIRGRGGIAEAYIGDTSIESQADLCVETAIELFGGVDLLAHMGPSEFDTVHTQNYRVSDFDKMMFNSVRASFLMVRYALPELKKAKGSVLSFFEHPKTEERFVTPAQTATHAWLYSFIKAVAEENRSAGVRANCVYGDHQSEETAPLCGFLLSEKAAEITGALYGGKGPLDLSAILIPTNLPDFKADRELSHRSARLDLSL